MDTLKEALENDQEVLQIIEAEQQRLEHGLELIASENICSRAVLQAIATALNDKYAEGYPGKRYYGGNAYIDEIERLAIERARRLFGAEHVNVQPYSGSPANIAVYLALLNFGDKLMGMSLAHGGHLTHGHAVNFSGRVYRVVHYGVDRETECINYDEVRRLALREQPRLIVSGATAYPRAIDFKAFQEICEEVGAYSMADISHIAGLCCTGLHANPVPSFDVVTTTTHKTLRGPRGAIIMCRQRFADAIDRAVFPGLQGGPHEHIIAGMAVAFGEALKPMFKEYASQVVKNAKALADELQAHGLRLVTGGTDNHLILCDVRPFGLMGHEAEQVLEGCGIYCNKNMIPFDTGTPRKPSGIRLGTPAVTTRGMRESEMREIGGLIAQALMAKGDVAKLSRVRTAVLELCRLFPIRR